jgi:hypothetical protein
VQQLFTKRSQWKIKEAKRSQKKPTEDKINQKKTKEDKINQKEGQKKTKVALSDVFSGNDSSR